MAQMNRMKSNLQTIESIVSELEAGNLTQQDLEKLVERTRELYEISLILRHKAYEEQVYGTTFDSTEVPVNSDVQTAYTSDEISLEMNLEDSEENELENLDYEAEQAQPSFEFSLFEEPTQPLEYSTNEALLEEQSIPFVASEEKTISVAEKELESQEFSTEMPVEAITDFAEMNSNGAFMNRFSVVDAQITNQIGMSHLETLIGSFGLNERLQYINELFDGSSEALSNAVKALDSASGYSDALLKIAQLADQYQWDLSSDTVEEFMVKIQRRHV